MAKSLLVLTALVVLILALAEAKQISFKDCGKFPDIFFDKKAFFQIFNRYLDDPGSMNGEVISVEITPCDQEPCIFKRGEQVLVEVDFTTTVRPFINFSGKFSSFFDVELVILDS
jgi:hypothetical protein